MVGLFVAYVGISYINFKLSYDKLHADSDNICRLARTYRSQDYSVIGFLNYSGSEADVQQRQIETLKTTLGVKTWFSLLILRTMNLSNLEVNG